MFTLLLALHTAYTQHFSFVYCAMRLSLIIMFVFHSIFIYYRRACRGTCVQRLHCRRRSRSSSSRRMCNQMIYDQPGGELLLPRLTRPILAPKSRNRKKNPHQEGERPVWSPQTGFIKYQRTFQSKRSESRHVAHTRSLHNCRV